jgi:tetratricopeptide (TPR) repeat protein
MRLLSGAALLALALAVHGRSVNHDLTFDDRFTVARAVPAGAGEAFRLWTRPHWSDTPEAGLYRPLAALSHVVDSWFWGGDPFGVHLGNVLLHALAVLLVARLARRWAGTRAAFAAGALFAVHPLTVEPVSSGVGRADLLAAVLVLAALLARKPLTIAVSFGLALLAKETAITVPLLLGIRALVDRRRAPVPLRSWALAVIVPAVLVLALRLLVLGRYALPGATVIPFGDNPAAGAPPGARILTALKVLLLQLGATVFPWPLTADASFDDTRVVTRLAAPESWGVLFGIGALAGLLALGSRWKGWRAGLTAALAAWLPVSNLLYPIGSLRADRLFYLPLAGIAVAGSAALARAPRRWTAAGLALALGALGTVAFLRVGDWRDDETLFRATVAAAPRCAKARANLAVTLAARGDPAGALPLLDEACAIHPENAGTLVRRGAVLRQLGRRAAAEADLRQALALDGERSEARVELALLLLETGRPSDADAELREALRREPANAAARLNLGNLLRERGELDAAEREYRRLLEEHPNASAAVSHLASVLFAKGRVPEAARLLETTLDRFPHDAAGWNNLGVLRRMMGDAPGAERAFRRALREDPALRSARDGLFWLLLRAGDSTGAARVVEDAAATGGPSWWVELRRGNAFLAAGRPDEAAASLASALDRDAAALADLAGALPAQARHGAPAERVVGLLLGRPWPVSIEVPLRALRADLLVSEGRDAEAAGELRVAVAKAPEDRTLRFALAVLLAAAIGGPSGSEGLEEARQAIALLPADSPERAVVEAVAGTAGPDPADALRRLRTLGRDVTLPDRVRGAALWHLALETGDPEDRARAERTAPQDPRARRRP